MQFTSSRQIDQSLIAPQPIGFILRETAWQLLDGAQETWVGMVFRLQTDATGYQSVEKGDWLAERLKKRLSLTWSRERA